MMNISQQPAAIIPGWMMRHPAMGAIVAEHQREVEAQRAATSAEMKRFQQQADKLAVAIQEEVQAAQDELKAWEAKREEMLHQHQTKLAGLRAAAADVERQVADRRASLVSDCDPAIDAAIMFFRDRMAEIRQAFRYGIVKISGKNAANFRQEVARRHNHEAVTDAAAYCDAAILELEAMKFHPHCDRDRIEEMKTGIPAADRFVISESYESCFE